MIILDLYGKKKIHNYFVESLNTIEKKELFYILLRYDFRAEEIT